MSEQRLDSTGELKRAQESFEGEAWLLRDSGALSRAAELALEGAPEMAWLEGSSESNFEGSFTSLDELSAWLSVHMNLKARHRSLSARDAAQAARDRVRFIAPVSIGWLAVCGKRGMLITAHGERSFKVTTRALRQLASGAELRVILLEPHLNLEALSKARSGGSPWARLGRLVTLERPIISALVIYALVLGALSLAVPVAVQVLVNTIAFGSLLQPLIILAIVLLGVLSFSGLVKLMEFHASELLQRRLFVRVAEDLARRLLVVDEASRAKVAEYGLANRFFEVVTLQKSVSKLLVEGLSIGLQAAVGLLLLGFYHPSLLAFDVALIIALVLIFVLGRGATPTALVESAAKYEVAGWIEQVGYGVAEVESPEARLQSARHADALTRRYLSARRAHYRHLFRQLAGGVALQVLAMVSLLGLGGWLVMQGELTLGQLVAAELVVGSLGASFVKLGPLLESTYDLLASVDKLGKLIDLPQQSAQELQSTQSSQGVKGVELPSSALSAAGSMSALQKGARLLTICAALGLIGLIFAPWQQSVTGSGRVIAYAPLERQQVVEAPIDGRVVRWFVQEGSVVREGEPIAELSDNDPEILARLERERAAAQAQVDAATLSIELTEARVRSEEAARTSSISTARMKVSVSREKELAAARSVDAAEATLKTAQLNLRRTKSLQKKGLASQRQLEVAELTERKARNDLERAKASLRAARADVLGSEADKSKVGSSTRASIDSTRSSLEKLKAERAKAEAELAKVEVKLARQNQMKVLAPRDGTILRLLAKQGTEMVSAGDGLVALVPSTEARAVELYVDGNDAPLIEQGREVRLQFEGWPAVQFVGWPSVAVGTFGGEVDFIDSHGDAYGRFRVVITPKEGEAWPEGRYLRQGVRSNGWILLNEVSVGFELWRQFNGFPPSLKSPEAQEMPKYGDAPKEKKKKKKKSKDKTP